MYHNVPKKMRKNDFKLSSCPKPSQLFAKCLGLTVPSYPCGQTAVVDIDPVVAVHRFDELEYNAYKDSLSKEDQESLQKNLEQ